MACSCFVVIYRRGQETIDTTLSLVMHPVGQDIFISCICRDHKLRMWSCKVCISLAVVIYRRGQETIDTTLSLVMHPVGQDFFISCICRDHKLRMWSCKVCIGFQLYHCEIIYFANKFNFAVSRGSWICEIKFDFLKKYTSDPKYWNVPVLAKFSSPF